MLRERGIPIVYTRHNTLPHKGDHRVCEAYRLIGEYADAVVHLGGYSLRQFRAKYPDSRQIHVVIPHHIYEGIYGPDITRGEAGKGSASRPTASSCWLSERSATISNGS